ncbi:hypothetical protein [Actinomadura parmotrematis]|uniref:WD40 repeat domain-containing protein n=1 Tax=Actinomadura parmotrematis TaxID=2864039 RepID=A0ABS7G1Y2_9ACTN|nr:hypothetical protein [Actinomadura parmotrematis]MBW8485889.1 hypothetical protein [Actinomadura parmotrematis]
MESGSDGREAGGARGRSDYFESVVEARLRAVRDAAVPPPGLAGRVLDGARRRRRARLAATSAAVAVASAAAGAAVVAAEAGPAPDAVGPGPALSRVLPDGALFRAMAVGADGGVLGLEVGRDGEPRRGVWYAPPGAAAPRHLADVPAADVPYVWTMAESRAAHAWPEGTSIACLPAGADGGPAYRLGRGWSGRDRFYGGGDDLVWDSGATITAVVGCTGAVRTFPVKGTLAAFGAPYAYVRSGAVMQRLDVRSGQVTRLRLPSAREPDGGFAASASVLAWADGGTLTIRAGGAAPVVLRGLPHAGDPSYDVRLSVDGDRRVVYSAVHPDGAAGRSLVYDLASRRRTVLPGEALGTDGRIIWRDGDLYRTS